MSFARAPRSLLIAFASNGVAEIVIRLSRIAVIVVVARVMEAEAIGLAAAAIAAGDILKALTETGVNQRVIRASDEELEDVAATAQRIFWVWCLGLFAVQQALAVGLWLLTGDTVVPWLVAVLGAEYLFMPAGLVQCALAMRAGKLSSTAAVGGAQIVLANLITAVLAFVWPVPMALVLPRLLSAPVWLLGMRRLHPWRRHPQARRLPLRPFLHFGAYVLGTELVKVLRLQADKILVGALLGAEALGVYFFAFNAGLGIANSVSTAFARVVFPYYCSAESRSQAFAESLRLAGLIAGPIILLQALSAPIYVPILFGEKWADISGVVSILCLAAIPTTIWSAAAQWLRAQDRPERELIVTGGLTVAVLASTAILAPFGLVAIAIGYVVVTTTILLAASVPVIRTCFPAYRYQSV